MKGRRSPGANRPVVAKSEIPTVLQTLAATPKEIARLARGRTAAALHRKPAPDAWSAQEIVAHLRACAEVWGGSIRRMLAEDRPTIRYVSPRGWIKKTDFLDQDFSDSLTAFAEERAALLKTLKQLRPIDWSRSATFTGTTLGRHATVLGYATRIGDHELRHLDQIRRTVR
jgi:hypothetical protein